MQSPSTPVKSNQSGLHYNLERIVGKHLAIPFQRPPSDHSKTAFDALIAATPAGASLILDSGCGTGDSTRRLARLFPDHFVIGIDRSVSRLARERETIDPNNMILWRADLVDLYGLMAEADWLFAHHFIFYPNPYPKAAHLQRRWHGSPVFPSMHKIGGQIELRSNWEIYVREFAAALEMAGVKGIVEKIAPDTDYASPFEQKYAKSGHELWAVIAPSTSGGAKRGLG